MWEKQTFYWHNPDDSVIMICGELQWRVIIASDMPSTPRATEETVGGEADTPGTNHATSAADLFINQMIGWPTFHVNLI